ncbi:hypothetical protein DLEV_154 [Diachasmimorpha longicaudata entomopoxvirus]|uniref:Uncharacterized protein n=1 Tax=Diachasmimorpha longicaudata entomopoxvirus TaxID=109981 RepID=A0A7R5WFF2_9POXV|nr:hypothetical protein QKK69_gp154 [Diachasmimorpha longicaudata entomopoxvirus]AKS26445.1 hypothetical protein DLEV_154 [Diachasmimorpha longicaudata entomopoxvirus]
MPKFVLIYLHLKKKEHVFKPDFFQQPLLFRLVKDYLDTKNFTDEITNMIFEDMSNMLSLCETIPALDPIETHHIELETKDKERNLMHVDNILDFSPELYALLEANKNSCIIITSTKTLASTLRGQITNTPELSKTFILFNNDFHMSEKSLVQIFKNTFVC